MAKKKTKVYVLCHSPRGINASQRFRLEQYEQHLAENNIELHFAPYFTAEATDFLYKKGGLLKKVFAVLRGNGRRKLDLLRMHSYDYVHIVREGNPLGPPIFEWLVAKILKKKIIFEFDDAVWMKQKTVNGSFARQKGKTAKVCKWANTVVGGNDFLVNYGKKHNPNVVKIPTTIDTKNWHQPIKAHAQKETTCIGWTGTFSNLPFLEKVLPALRELHKKHSIRFKIICNQEPPFDDDFIEFIPWKRETEIADLLDFDIGLMPLENTEWAKGKCGFKALQYLALGIPALASPVGVNGDIVENGVNGFLCESSDEWLAALETLVESPDKRSALGKAGRKKVKEEYSVDAWAEKYVELYR